MAQSGGAALAGGRLMSTFGSFSKLAPRKELLLDLSEEPRIEGGEAPTVHCRPIMAKIGIA